MKHYLLIGHTDEIKIIKKEEDLRRELLTLCFQWTHDGWYDGDPNEYQDIFNESWAEHDFQDVARVYEYDSGTGLELAETESNVVLTRIY